MGPAIIKNAEDDPQVSCSVTVPSVRDKIDFRASYIPASPEVIHKCSGAPQPGQALIVFEAVHVRVENRFVVERKGRDGSWVDVDVVTAAPLFPNRDSDVLHGRAKGQTPGWATYRVVADTEAPLQNVIAASEGTRIKVLPSLPPLVACTPGPVPRSIDPGDPLPMDCRLAAPTNLRVTSVSGTSATLTWNDVAPATGSKVRLDGIAYNTDTLGDVNSYVFDDLTPGTAHVLEVASSVAGGDSAFASLTLLAPPTLSTPSTTSSSITLSWTDDDNAARAEGYDVKRVASGSNCEADGVDGSTSSTSFSFSQGVLAGTTYVICVRARNEHGTSAWASITARTITSVPPKVWDPASLNCLTSRNTGQFIAWKDCCSSTSAATLLGWLGDPVVGVLRWDGSQWLRYAVVGGSLVPGSTNFTISAGATLWLLAASSARSAATFTPPTPTAEDLKRLAELAAQ